MSYSFNKKYYATKLTANKEILVKNVTHAANTSKLTCVTRLVQEDNLRNNKFAFLHDAIFVNSAFLFMKTSIAVENLKIDNK